MSGSEQDTGSTHTSKALFHCSRIPAILSVGCISTLPKHTGSGQSDHSCGPEQNISPPPPNEPPCKKLRLGVLAVVWRPGRRFFSLTASS